MEHAQVLKRRCFCSYLPNKDWTYVPHDYATALESLGRSSLVARRVEADLKILLKLLNGDIDSPCIVNGSRLQISIIFLPGSSSYH